MQVRFVIYIGRQPGYWQAPAAPHIPHRHATRSAGSQAQLRLLLVQATLDMLPIVMFAWAPPSQAVADCLAPNKRPSPARLLERSTLRSTTLPQTATAPTIIEPTAPGTCMFTSFRPVHSCATSSQPPFCLRWYRLYRDLLMRSSRLILPRLL